MTGLDDLGEKMDQNNKEEIENSEETNVPEQGKADNLDEQTENLDEKLAAAQDKYLRLSAEFDNYRKRTLKERYELIKTAGEDVIKELLPVIDDFDRAMEAIAATENVTTLAEGVQLIQDKLLGILKQKGLTPIQTVGLAFDPEVCEAIASIPADQEMKGKVIEEIQKGYRLNEKIIRYPKVVVGE